MDGVVDPHHQQPSDNDVFWWLMTILLLIHGTILVASMLAYLFRHY